MVRELLTALGLWLGVVASLGAQVVGPCYDVTLGPWQSIESSHTNDLPRRRPPDQSGDSVELAIPSRIRLDEAPSVPPRPGLKLASVPSNTLQVPHAFRWWSERGDSLFVGLSTGLVGTSSRMTKAERGWVGLARTFSDIGGALQYERPIDLTRVACSSPPTESAALDPALPRRIETVGHGWLELGGPLPSGTLPEPRSSEWSALRVEAAGSWAGHSSVVVRMDPAGVVHHIELQYPAGFDLSELTDWLLAWQTPTRYLSGVPFWTNRTTEIFVQAGDRPRVSIRDRRYF